MPHKRVSDDIDHVPIDPKPSKIPKKKPPPPGPAPQHVPLLINNPLLDGHGELPPGTKADDPCAIFSLFFSDQTLSEIRDNTNQYAELYPSAPNVQFARK